MPPLSVIPVDPVKLNPLVEPAVVLPTASIAMAPVPAFRVSPLRLLIVPVAQLIVIAPPPELIVRERGAIESPSTLPLIVTTALLLVTVVFAPITTSPL